MAKKRKRKTPRACTTATVKFKTKRGKVISFKGHTGANCPPRKYKKPTHLRVYQEAFASGAHACAKKTSGAAFRKCVGAAVKGAARSNR